MRYFAKFDAAGNRETSIAEGVHFKLIPARTINTGVLDDEGNPVFEHEAAYIDPSIPEGFVEISVEEQELYQTNEYIRDTKTGKPVPRPPYVPTAEDKANAIALQYTAQIAELKDALATATLAGDDGLVTELRTEYAALMAQYQAELEEIGNG